MKKQARADGRTEAPTIVAINSLRPALASITDACRYLGDLSRSRIYELMPRLDVVHIGARTFITLQSLDRLIAANMQPAADATR